MSEYSVQLVDPVTKQAFKEHFGFGRTYVEVEPKAEYFIKIQRKNNHGMGWFGSERAPLVCADIEVDGTNLGYKFNDTLETPKFGGSWRLVNNISTMTALRFGTIIVSNPGAKPIDISGGLVGTVTVNVFEAIFDSVCTDYNNYSSPNLSLQVAATLARDGDKKKTVRTETGAYSQSDTYPATFNHYRKGQLIEKITLYYATAFGLIHASILAKPPLWDQARLEAPSRNEEIDPELVGIQPTIIKDNSLAAFGVKSKEYECFDLTHLATDDD
jgi:hypothetical protein